MHRMIYVRSIAATRKCIERSLHRDVRFGAEVRNSMMRGVNVLADAVAVTMGPKGRSVILDQHVGPPKITKDGATVARFISLPDKHMNIGARLVQDVSENTNKLAGDGTTTATVLARAIAREGFDRVTSGCNPAEIREGIMLAVSSVKSQLKEMSKPVQTRHEIEQVATLSANGDKDIGSLIGEATERVGHQGSIIVREGKLLKDKLEVIEGMEFYTGYVSPFFINCPKGAKVEYSNAYVLISMKKIPDLSKIVGAMELCMQKRKPLILLAKDISGDSLNGLVLNRLKLNLQICAVKAPSFGEMGKELIGDIAAATGATIFGDDADFERIECAKESDFGEVGEAIITKRTTMLLKAKSKPAILKRRIKEIENELEDYGDSMNEKRKLKLKERLSRLTKGVAILHVGGTSEVEVSEKRDRIDDALNATRAAIEQGIVPGGGTAFLRCIPKLLELRNSVEKNDLRTGIKIVCNALRVPCLTIADNAGVDSAQVVEKVMAGSGDFGYDAMRNEYGNLIGKGIIDATKVMTTAISDAASVASLLSTTDVVITNTRNMDLLSKLASMGGMDGIGGMDGMGGLGGMGGMGGMDGMEGLEGLAGMDGMDDDEMCAEDANEVVKSMKGMEDIEVRDIDSSIL